MRKNKEVQEELTSSSQLLDVHKLQERRVSSDYVLLGARPQASSVPSREKNTTNVTTDAARARQTATSSDDNNAFYFNYV